MVNHYAPVFKNVSQGNQIANSFPWLQTQSLAPRPPLRSRVFLKLPGILRSWQRYEIVLNTARMGDSFNGLDRKFNIKIGDSSLYATISHYPCITFNTKKWKMSVFFRNFVTTMNKRITL